MYHNFSAKKIVLMPNFKHLQLLEIGTNREFLQYLSSGDSGDA